MSYMDILMEQLRHYDEVQLLEMLDISTNDLLEAFKNKIIERKDYIEREIEFLPMSDEDIEKLDEEELDGFQIYEYTELGEEDYDV